MKELVLHGLFIAKNLDVVHQEHVGTPKTLVESSEVIESQRLNHFVHKAFGGCVDDLAARVQRECAIGDGMQQVGLAHAHLGMQVQRVECPGWIHRNTFASGAGELVA